jgi:hypothetical protein
MESRANLGERLRSIEHHLSAGGKLDSKDADDLLAIARAQSSLLKRMAEALEFCDSVIYGEFCIGKNPDGTDHIALDGYEIIRQTLAAYHQAMAGEG